MLQMKDLNDLYAYTLEHERVRACANGLGSLATQVFLAGPLEVTETNGSPSELSWKEGADEIVKILAYAYDRIARLGRVPISFDKQASGERCPPGSCPDGYSCVPCLDKNWLFPRV